MWSGVVLLLVDGGDTLVVVEDSAISKEIALPFTAGKMPFSDEQLLNMIIRVTKIRDFYDTYYILQSTSQ